MATPHTAEEQTEGNRQTSSRFPTVGFEQRAQWLGVATYVAGCVLLSAGVLLGAGLATAYFAALIPGAAGVVVFVMVGLGLIGAAPEIARWVCIHAWDLVEPHRVE